MRRAAAGIAVSVPHRIGAGGRLRGRAVAGFCVPACGAAHGHPGKGCGRRAAHWGLAREEIERSIDKTLFEDLEHKIIGKPLIPKLRRSYTLPDGSVLEVNHVDEGQPTEFWYAEVEYPTVEAALAWQPESCGLGDYLKDEVTNQPGQSMGEYWVETRG